MAKQFEDTKGVTRNHKSKDRQYNDQTKKYKRTNNNTQKTKERATLHSPSVFWWGPCCSSF